MVPLNGTDLLSIKPDVQKNDDVWGFIDDLYRTVKLEYYGDVEYEGLSGLRFM